MPVVGGAFKKETLAWIKDVLKRAGEQNKAVIAMQHHGLVEHWDGQHKYHTEYLVKDYKKISELFARNNVRLIFTGHYHAQDVSFKSFDKKFIFDIETGSFVSYPSPWRTITLKDNTATVESRYIEGVFGIDGNFQDFSKEFTANGIRIIAKNTLLGLNSNEADAVSIADQVADAYMVHYAGDETPASSEEILKTEGLATMGKLILSHLGYVIEGLWLDNPGFDRSIIIDLEDGSFTH